MWTIHCKPRTKFLYANKPQFSEFILFLQLWLTCILSKNHTQNDQRSKTFLYNHIADLLTSFIPSRPIMSNTQQKYCCGFFFFFFGGGLFCISILENMNHKKILLLNTLMRKYLF